MPTGAAGLVRLITSKWCDRAAEDGRRKEEAMRNAKRALIASVAACCRPCGSPGRRAEEIRSRRERHRDQDRQHHAVQGPASAYGTIGKAQAAYFRMINEQGGINGRKINFISYDDAYSPPKTVEQARKLVEGDEVLLIFQSLGTAANSAIQKYMNAKKVPQLFVATGATKWGDPKNFPWTMGFQPNYQSEGRIYAKYILENHPAGKIGCFSRTTTTARTC